MILRFWSVAVCHSGPLLLPCVLSKFHPVAVAVILLWRKGLFVVLVCEEGVWLLWCNWDVFNREKNSDKMRMAGYERAKNKFKKCYTFMCTYVHIFIYVW